MFHAQIFGSTVRAISPSGAQRWVSLAYVQSWAQEGNRIVFYPSLLDDTLFYVVAELPDEIQARREFNRLLQLLANISTGEEISPQGTTHGNPNSVAGTDPAAGKTYQHNRPGS